MSRNIYSTIYSKKVTDVDKIPARIVDITANIFSQALPETIKKSLWTRIFHYNAKYHRRLLAEWK